MLTKTKIALAALLMLRHLFRGPGDGNIDNSGGLWRPAARGVNRPITPASRQCRHRPVLRVRANGAWLDRRANQTAREQANQ